MATLLFFGTNVGRSFATLIYNDNSVTSYNQNSFIDHERIRWRTTENCTLILKLQHFLRLSEILGMLQIFAWNFSAWFLYNPLRFFLHRLGFKWTEMNCTLRILFFLSCFRIPWQHLPEKVGSVVHNAVIIVIINKGCVIQALLVKIVQESCNK